MHTNDLSFIVHTNQSLNIGRNSWANIANRIESKTNKKTWLSICVKQTLNWISEMVFRFWAMLRWEIENLNGFIACTKCRMRYVNHLVSTRSKSNDVLQCDLNQCDELTLKLTALRLLLFYKKTMLGHIAWIRPPVLRR